MGHCNYIAVFRNYNRMCQFQFGWKLMCYCWNIYVRSLITRAAHSPIILGKYYVSIYKRFFVSFLLFGLAFIMIRIYELARLNRSKASRQLCRLCHSQPHLLSSLLCPCLCTFDFGIFRFSLNYFTLQTKLNQNAHKSNAKLLFWAREFELLSHTVQSHAIVDSFPSQFVYQYVSLSVCVCVSVWQTVSWCCFLSILASKQNKRKSTTATANDEPQQLIIKLIWFNTRQQLHPSLFSLSLLDCSRERERERERMPHLTETENNAECSFRCPFSTVSVPQAHKLPACLPSHTSRQTKRQSAKEKKRGRGRERATEHPN